MLARLSFQSLLGIKLRNSIGFPLQARKLSADILNS